MNRLKERFLKFKKQKEETYAESEDCVLPSGIEKRVHQRYLIAIAICIISFLCVIYYKDFHYIVGVVLAAYFAYLGKSLKRDWNNGRIEEIVLICNSIQDVRGVGTGAKRIQNVSFRTTDEIPQYYVFRWTGGKKDNPFHEGAVYVIYYDPMSPHELQGFQEL